MTEFRCYTPEELLALKAEEKYRDLTWPEFWALRAKECHLSVLAYLKKVVATYVTDEDHLFNTLMIENPDFDDSDSKRRELLHIVETRALNLGALLARWRMQPTSTTSDQEESQWRILDEALQLAGKVSDVPNPTFPDKWDLIEVGILSLILEKLETGKDRFAALDLLSFKLPKRLEHLQPVFYEVHLNYILGNRHAVVAMCGAVIESVVKEFARDEIFLSRGIPRRDITFRQRINEMQKMRLLEPERVECALAIWERRGYAVHADPKFPFYTDEMIEGTLLDTRKILDELFKEQ
jgi:hypothetical protein